jgi:hypothetical protein
MKHETRLLVVPVVMALLGLVVAACAGAPAVATPAPLTPTSVQPSPTPVPPTPTPLPSTPTPSITVDDLIGVWLATKTGMDYVQFNQDGTYRHAKAVPWLETAPVEVGQFRLEGTTLTFISGNDSQECRGQSGSYQVELMGAGQLQLVLQEDACQYRANYRPGPRERIPPTPAPSSISVEDVIGLWYDADRNEYLQLNQDGTYRVATTVSFLEASPYEVGEFQLEGTSFTFITSNESPDCKDQTGRYQVKLTEPGQLQFVLQEDACQARADEQPGSWDRMPPTPVPGISQEDLIGIWTGSLTVGTERITYVFQFNEDGTWRAAQTADLLDCCPAEWGEFQLEGTSLTFITSDESAFCKGQTGTYELKLAEEDQLQFVLFEDACSPRTSIVIEPWSRASP